MTSVSTPNKQQIEICDCFCQWRANHKKKMLAMSLTPASPLIGEKGKIAGDCAATSCCFTSRTRTDGLAYIARVKPSQTIQWLCRYL